MKKVDRVRKPVEGAKGYLMTFSENVSIYSGFPPSPRKISSNSIINATLGRELSHSAEMSERKESS